MSSLKYLNTVLTVLAVLLGLQLWTSWTADTPASNPAWAQGIPDEGAQRKQMIDELKLLNVRTAQVHKLLASGKLRVVMTAPEQE